MSAGLISRGGWIFIRPFAVGIFLSLVGMGDLSARALPQWSPEDRARVKKGELVVGASLLVDNTRRQPISSVDIGPVVPVPVPVELLEPDVQGDGVLIPDEYISDYFSSSPGAYFIDPQRLFSNQETLDQEGFLEYCAEESEVDIRIYLFDGQQEIPEGYSLKRLVEERYADAPLTAVVFYFLGNPKRNQLLFGGDGGERLGSEKLRKMLDRSKIKAMEKSDAAAQMESFIVQLSISIYWVEQSIAEARAMQTSITPPESQEEKSTSSTMGVWEKIQPYLLYVGVGLSSVLMIAASVMTAWVVWRRSRRYRFPVLDLPCRLGADDAAGVGAVIGFHNKRDSPSSQRNTPPDYIAKL